MTTRALIKLSALLCLGFALLWGGTLTAEEAPAAFSDQHLQTINQALDAADTLLQADTASQPQLDSLLTEAVTLGQTAQTCISQFGQRQTQTKQSIESLGAPIKNEGPEVTNKRKQLAEQQKQVEKTLSQCRLIGLRVTNLQDLIHQTKQDSLKKELFTPSPSLWGYLQGLFASSSAWQTDLERLETALEAVPFNTATLLYRTLTYSLLGLFLWGGWYAYRHSRYHQPVAQFMEGIIPIKAQARETLSGWVRALLLALLLAALPHSKLLEQTPPNNWVGLACIFTDTLIGLVMIRLVWLLAEHSLLMKNLKLQWLSSAALLVAVVAEWVGYQHFATTIFQGVLGSVLLLLLTWLLLRIPTEIFDGLDAGHAPWQQRIRQQLALRDGQIVPGLLWVRLTHTLLVVSGGGLLLLRLWGMSEQTLWLLLTQLASGIQIAGFTLEPLRIIAGLLVVAVLISLTHLFKNHLSETWLERTTLSRGAREATTTISGYVGILFAILFGLSVAGIELKNLAIIAGALSVGIGFGLQNIVNNFVSGLIMLFERPIRRGDWIKVGAAEGYVKEISIRSTTIQTRDRSDIIVPNSELISGQVTNMMLDDVYGRLIIPVSVAYGSDTDRVIGILRSLAEAHPAVVKGRDDMRVAVFLRSFADSALNFELRCFIDNVESNHAVTSDLNLAVNKAFRASHIEIPASQRTLHLVIDDNGKIQQDKLTP